MRDRGHRLEFVGREVVSGIDYHVLRLTLDDGFESLYYLNPASWLIDRDRQRRALHVDVDPTPEWIETSYEDYRPVGGVLFPHRQVERRLATGDVLATVTLRADPDQRASRSAFASLRPELSPASSGAPAFDTRRGSALPGRVPSLATRRAALAA